MWYYEELFSLNILAETLVNEREAQTARRVQVGFDGSEVAAQLAPRIAVIREASQTYWNGLMDQTPRYSTAYSDKGGIFRFLLKSVATVLVWEMVKLHLDHPSYSESRG